MKLLAKRSNRLLVTIQYRLASLNVPSTFKSKRWTNALIILGDESWHKWENKEAGEFAASR